MKNSIVDELGTKKYYNFKGQLHRTNEPAIEYRSGAKFWYQNDQLHRLDGSAIEYSHSKYWYQYGLLNREDGPAVECSDGYKEYWVDGKNLTEEEFVHWCDPI